MHYCIYTECFPSRRADAPRQTGIGRYCEDLAWGLTELGHGVTVLTNSEVVAAAGDGREPFRLEVLGEAPRGWRASVARGREVLRRASADPGGCLLVGDPLAHTALIEAARPSPVPLYPIFYGTELALWAQGYWSRRFPHSPLWRRRLRRYLADSTMPVCISRYTANLLSAFAPGAVGPERQCIVYPCVSPTLLRRPVNRAFGDRLRRQLTRDGSTPLVLVTVARISERKNQLAVLEALDRLRHSGGPSWHYVIVGNLDGPQHEGYAARLRGFAAERGLQEVVTFVRRATDEEKVDYLDACDASIMLSRTVGASVEGFGISVIEASARGKPVIVSDQGGMPETIVEGVTGTAVPPDDVPRIAAELAALARDPARRAAWGEAGRRRTLADFTPTATAGVLHARVTAVRSRGGAILEPIRAPALAGGAERKYPSV
jgi:glycosyltransferase involved in cell wall biosynthesis